MSGTVPHIVFNQLESLMRREAELLGGVDTAFKDIKRELQNIKSFLREVDEGEEREGMRTWVGQVREIVYDIEDLLEGSMLYFRQTNGRGFVGFLRQITHITKHFFARHRIATALQKIKTDVLKISQGRNWFDVNVVNDGMGPNPAIDQLHDRHVVLFTNEAELVGIDKPRDDLVGLLLKEGYEPKVISVVGMAGLGKTTLVRKVYDSEIVKGWFTCHAWIAMTQSTTINELLRNTITQLYKERDLTLPENIGGMDNIELTEILRHYLRNERYVVVFDDLCDTKAWGSLESALFDNDLGSKILVTTRIRQVGKHTSSGHLYDLQPLSSDQAWLLFCKKAFQPEVVCPPELEEISQDIVKNCGGLPLAITAIGGLMSKKEKTVVEWRTLLNNLQSELANNANLMRIKRIISVSYNDLPHFLKSCFLYFSIFPKGYFVKRMTLIRLWIAEGFIENEHSNDTLEEIAEGYLNDLIDRNMIQVAEFYNYGRVKSCRVHNVTHEILVLKSKEENFSTTLTVQNTEINGRIRRLSIHNTSVDVLRNISSSQVRALFMFGQNAFSISSMATFLSGFIYLKVLDLKGAPIEKVPVEFKKLAYLRYLSFRDTRISTIPKSLGKLKYLQTLDLKGTFVSELPKKILKLQNLRHLLAYYYYTGSEPPNYYTGVRVPRGIGSLRGLQKLSYLEANQDSGIIRELGNLTQLKRLGIVKLRSQDGDNLCASIEMMTNLHSFSLTSVDTDELLNLQSLMSPPPLLQRLYLRGPLKTLPNWIASLQNLVRMHLNSSRLGDDSLQVLQDLPNLLELTLIRAYDGVMLRCENGGFQKLKILDLEGLAQLKNVIVVGAMPNLLQMYIRGCTQLQMVPSGIEQLINLKELHLFDMPEEFVQSLQSHGGTDHSKIKHIPVVRFYGATFKLHQELQ